MADYWDKDTDSTLPARRSEFGLQQSEAQPLYPTVHQPPESGPPASGPVPLPEFLSLTYTLPYHLVEQINELARETNRSPSELVADSIRLYLESLRAHREQSHLYGAGEVFAQQEVIQDVTPPETTSTTSYDDASEPEAAVTDSDETDADRPMSYIERLRARGKARAENEAANDAAEQQATPDHRSQPDPEAARHTDATSSDTDLEPEAKAEAPTSETQAPASEADAPSSEADASTSEAEALKPEPEEVLVPEVVIDTTAEALDDTGARTDRDLSPGAASSESPESAKAPEDSDSREAETGTETSSEAEAATATPSEPKVTASEQKVPAKPEPAAGAEPATKPAVKAAQQADAKPEPPAKAAPAPHVTAKSEPKGDAQPPLAAAPEAPTPQDPPTAAESGPDRESQQTPVVAAPEPEPGSPPAPASATASARAPGVASDATPEPPTEPASGTQPAAGSEKSRKRAPAPPARPTESADGLSAEDRALQEIADPALDVRRQLQDVQSEPLDSNRLLITLKRIMERVDRKDFSPPEHSTKVADMAHQLGKAKGFRGARLHAIYIAGLVHDIGKACIPDEVLKKPKPSPEEMALIRKYPEFGVDLLEPIAAMRPLLPVIAAHQERWNGSGYPNRLARNDIPVGAQIVALCDVYDVLITDRRYRPAYTDDRARQIIQQNVGTLWNPEIGRTLLTRVLPSEKKTPVGHRR